MNRGRGAAIAAERSMEPIRRISPHEEVLKRLREMVVEGAWQPGEIIPELSVCAELQVSRTPIREALKVLAAEGLVDVLPRQGARIRIMAPAEARQIFEATGDIEAAAGRRACARASEAAIRRIGRLHGQMQAAYEQGQRRAYFEANQAIHRAIVEAGGNTVLSGIHQRLSARMRRIRYACTNEPESWKQAMDEHEQIMRSLAARDAERLADVLVRHMQGGWQRVSAFVNAEKLAAAPRATPARGTGRRQRAGQSVAG
jgi:DNA-binding GntR family transcriptional regulator